MTHENRRRRAKRSKTNQRQRATPGRMSLRVAAAASTPSSLASSSTPATTPVTPQNSARSSFHVFRATASPPPVLRDVGSLSISRKPSQAPSTPLITSASVQLGDDGNDSANTSANDASLQAKGKEKERPQLVAVDIDAAAEEARQRGRRKGRRDEEAEIMAQTAARYVRHCLDVL